MKPKLYIMCGLPYSGKTTYAKSQAAEKGYILVSIDDIRESLGFYWGEQEASVEDWRGIFAKVDAHITNALKMGLSVIYDSANQDKASRSRLKQLANDVGCDFQIWFVNTPIEVILNRRQANLDNPTRSHIPQDAFDAAIATFEPPTSQEADLKLITD